MYSNQQNQIPATQNQQNNSGNSNNSNNINVPEARAALDNMKFEIASELGINLKPGYNGDLPSRQAGYIGGYMVKRMIEQQERQMSGK
ncbi:MAG: alpha/beta-type small acid-soluble spore protein [Clostridia bacterium]|nr:alpha/beta-type small acid-soluble spore protein [Clostridia bacterium]